MEKISELEPNELTFITQIAVTDCMLVCESGGTIGLNHKSFVRLNHGLSYCVLLGKKGR